MFDDDEVMILNGPSLSRELLCLWVFGSLRCVITHLLTGCACFLMNRSSILRMTLGFIFHDASLWASVPPQLCPSLMS